MTQQLSPEEQKAVAVVIGAIMVIGTAIMISRTLFPFFLVGSIISLIALIICGVIDIKNSSDFYGNNEILSIYPGIIFVICMLGTLATYGIGYGLGGTTFGVAVLQVYDSINGMEEDMNNAINQAIEESCKTLPSDSCIILKQSAKTAKTLKEVQDIADNLQKASKTAQKVNERISAEK